ncbi:MAG: SCO family protein [Nitrospirota bacterium]
MAKTVRVIFACFLLFINTANAHDVEGHQAAEAEREITVNEHLGSYVPLDIPFYDEKGDTVLLNEFAGKPVVIAPVYLSCNHTCPLLMLGLADVIAKSGIKPGRDYQVLSISFDENDTPQTASEKKPGYLKAAGIILPDDSWRFLTGNAESIRRFTQAAGFEFRKEHMGFSHPVTLIFLAPDGKIVRYLYGVTFLPFEFEMAVTEASKGRVISLAKKALLYCMSYDSQNRRYVFNTLKVAATLALGLIGSFFVYLIVTGKKSKIKNQDAK